MQLDIGVILRSFFVSGSNSAFGIFFRRSFVFGILSKHVTKKLLPFLLRIALRLLLDALGGLEKLEHVHPDPDELDGALHRNVLFALVEPAQARRR